MLQVLFQNSESHVKMDTLNEMAIMMLCDTLPILTKQKKTAIQIFHFRRASGVSVHSCDPRDQYLTFIVF